MNEINTFTGFSKESFRFLKDLEKNNSKKFFDKNRERYDNFLVAPAKAFITSIAPFFEQLNSSIRTEPKFNKTIMRLNKDMRFQKGDPYRTFLLIHFGRFKMDSEFYLYLDSSGMSYGVFFNKSKDENLFLRENLEKYDKEFTNIFNKYELNNKFRLQNLEQEPELEVSRFNINKHFDNLKKLKLLLLDKSLELTNKLCYSPKLITELIKIYSRLYPIYCFAISPTPMKLIAEFEEKMGVAL